LALVQDWAREPFRVRAITKAGADLVRSPLGMLGRSPRLNGSLRIAERGDFAHLAAPSQRMRADAEQAAKPQQSSRNRPCNRLCIFIAYFAENEASKRRVEVQVVPIK
jgi:hypothetical protein